MDTKTETPLIEAVRAGDHMKAWSLMMKGANWAAKQADGKSAYDLAKESGNPQMLMVFQTHIACG